MPAMANIVIKKFDGTTNITYTAIIPSGGDRLKAVWRSESYASSAANRPTLEIMAKSNQSQTQRIVEVLFKYPELVTDSTTGVTSVRLRDVGSLVMTVDQRGTDATTNEACAQFANLMASPLVQETLRTGAAPT